MIGKAKAPTIPTLCHEDNVGCTDKEKADLLAKTYSNTSDTFNYPATFQTYKYNFESKNYSFINKISVTENKSHPMNKDFSMSELVTALDRCCDTSSPGQDNISFQIIKKIPPPTLHTRLRVLKDIWKEGKLPPDWKISLQENQKLIKNPTVQYL